MDDGYNEIITAYLNPLEGAFANLIGELDPNGGQPVQLAAALALRACRNGHVCLNLLDIHRSASLPEEINIESEQLLHSLQMSHLVGKREEFKPLILEGNRLYLQRYWQYEQRLGKALLRLAAGKKKVANNSVLTSLESLFPSQDSEINWQKVAAVTALLKQLVVISGGPGTGKTTTVVKIMVLLQKLAGEKPLRIGLAAPTGKAVARLSETIQSLNKTLSIPSALKETIPDQAVTVHRLLGSRRYSPYFKHHSENPLQLDILIVDEASMVDLALMCKIVEALPEQGSLILLGDKDQLASVEAGRVMGDICLGGTAFSQEFADTLAQMGCQLENTCRSVQPTFLQDNIVLLEKNYRFEGTGGIGSLTKAIQEGNAESALACLTGRDFLDLDFSEYCEGWLEDFSRRFFYQFSGLFEATNPDEALNCFNNFRVLCVHRHGFLGVSEMNRRVEKFFRQKGTITSGDEWYHGRPIMIRRNDYELGVFNGDTGICMVDGEGIVRVYFSGSENISVNPARLQHYETAYCMTVHKSQGSEFDEVALLLPEKFSAILTKELVYTAVSRARKKISLWGNNDVLREAIRTGVARNSGLSQFLYPEQG